MGPQRSIITGAGVLGCWQNVCNHHGGRGSRSLMSPSSSPSTMGQARSNNGDVATTPGLAQTKSADAFSIGPRTYVIVTIWRTPCHHLRRYLSGCPVKVGEAIQDSAGLAPRIRKVSARLLSALSHMPLCVALASRRADHRRVCPNGSTAAGPRLTVSTASRGL